MLGSKNITSATRNAMADLLKSEGLLNSAVWSGAIHYNTDNIHVHVAFVEPEPTRELMMYKGTLQRRGKLKYSNIERAKSRIANSISDRTLDFQKISFLYCLTIAGFGNIIIMQCRKFDLSLIYL